MTSIYRFALLSILLHVAAGAYLWTKYAELLDPVAPSPARELTVEVVQSKPPAPAPPKKEKASPPAKPKPEPKREAKKPLPAKKPVAKPKKKPQPRKPRPIQQPKVAIPEPVTQAPVETVEATQAPPSKARQVPSTAIQAEKQNYRAALRAAILENRRYPRQAVRRRMEGTVNIRFTLLKSGQIVSISVAKSSGHSLLDNAAKEAVERVGHFKPIPEEYKKEFWEFTIPATFKLR